jgi:hypothetical protein
LVLIGAQGMGGLCILMTRLSIAKPARPAQEICESERYTSGARRYVLSHALVNGCRAWANRRNDKFSACQSPLFPTEGSQRPVPQLLRIAFA